MRWSDIPRRPSPRMLRQFAALWLAALGALGAREWLARGHPALGGALCAAGVVVGVLGLIRPPAIRPLFVGWMVLAFPIGWTASQLMLALIFYGVFTPMALAFRLIGRDALALRPREDEATYWTPRAEPADVRRYFRQF